MKPHGSVGIISMLTVVLVFSSFVSKAFQKPVPDISISIPANGKVGDVFPLTVDKAGSTGAVTWSASGVLSIEGDQLHLNAVGAGLMTVRIAEDDNYAPFTLYKVVVVLADDTGENPDLAQVWGTTQAGGAMNVGTVFRMNADGTGYTVMAQLASDPFGVGNYYNGQMLASDGKIYSVLPAGGINNSGILYGIDLTTKQFEIVNTFSPTSGSNPQGIFTEVDGILYGVTNEGGDYESGTLYTYDIDTKNTAIVHSFDWINGARPTTPPRLATNGKLYGVTFTGGIGAGVLYEFDPDTKQYAVKHTFDYGTEGAFGWAAPVEASNGKMYGMLTQGGPNAAGGLYEFDPATGDVDIKIAFTQSDLLYNLAGFTEEFPNGKMYTISQFGGTNYTGMIAEYTPGATSYTALHSFETDENGSANGLTVGANGKLYGVRSALPHGFLFEYDPATDDYSHLYDFTSGSASAAVVEGPDGLLYGQTGGGDSENAGVFYSYDREEGEFTVIKTFYYSLEGMAPQGALAADGSKLLITNTQGGLHQDGTAMEFDMTTNMLKKTIDYSYAETGIFPNGWIQHSNKKFYGVTQQGGENGTGTINMYDPATHQITVVYNFPGYTGDFRLAADIETTLTQGADGLLYGIGSNTSNDAIFRFDPATNSMDLAYEFAGSNEEGNNHQGVVFAANKIWGIATGGGTNSLGLIFSYSWYPESELTVVHNFESDDNGTLPIWGPIVAKNGMLYGTAQGNGINKGVIYEINPETGAYTAKYKFTDAELSARPLVKGAGGKLLGFTVKGGESNLGYIFEYDVLENTVTIRHHFSFQDGARTNGTWLLLKRDSRLALTIDDQTFSTDAITLTAETPAAVPVSFTALTDNITIDGETLTMIKPGRATVKAEQFDDDNFKDGVVETSFCINPIKPTITVEGVGTQTITLTSSAEEGNEWYKNGEVAGTTKSITADADGIYYVKVKADDCENHSDEEEITVTGLEDDLAKSIRVYPNPATNELMVDVPAAASSAKLNLLDHLGRPIESRTAQPGTTEKFDVGHLPASLYIVRISQDGKTVNKVFVKR